MASVTANGVRIEYETHGDASAEPLLLLMGLGGQLTDWSPGFIKALTAEGFFVITPDNRDQGLSTDWGGPRLTTTQLLRAVLTRRPPPHQYTLGEMAADHLAVLDDLGVDEVHVVGRSMGGMLAQHLAFDHPQRVASLCSIMSTTGDLSVGRPTWKVALKLFRQRRIPREEALGTRTRTIKLIAGPAHDPNETLRLALISDERSFRPDGTTRQLAAILAGGDRTGRLASVRAPALVIHGAVDPLIDVSGGIATARAMPGSRLLVFPEMGHYLPRLRWPEIARAIRNNAQRAESPARVGSVNP